MSLSSEEIEQRWAAVEQQVEQAKPYRWVRPLEQIGRSLIEALRVEDGLGLGIAAVDVLTRGFRPTDLCLITGFAHSGKTQLVNTMLLNNPAKRVLFFSLDDPAEMILAKLVAMHNNMSAERIELRIRDNDPGTQRMVLETAAQQFPNLVVVDDVIGIPSMQEAVQEATTHWGAPPDAVVIDYVEMMPGNGVSVDQAANVKEKLNDLKKWAKSSPFPLIVLHQGTRSNARPGEPITLLSMGFSGEQQATIVLGCRRKRDKEDLDAHDRMHHQDSITVHVVKNKRPGGRLTHPEGIDLHMDPHTGMITNLRNSSSVADTVQTHFGYDD